jgi:predicted PurR-regulated permease PerM
MRVAMTSNPEGLQVAPQSIRYFNQSFLRTLIYFILLLLGLFGAYRVFPYLINALFMVTMAVVLTAVISPVIDYLQAKGVKRVWGTVIFFGGIITLITLVIVRGLPGLIEEIGKINALFQSQAAESTLAGWIDAINARIAAFYPDYQLSMESLSRLAAGFFGQIGSIVSGTINAGLNAVFILIITLFFLVDGDRMMKRLIETVPNRYFEMALNISYQTQKQLTNFLRGQLLAATGVGVMSIIGLNLLNWIFDANISGPFIIGSIAGLANMIPYIGPFIGMVPAIIVSLFNNMGDPAATASYYYILHIIIMFLIVQQIDNYLISPLVVSGSMEMHPLTVMLVVLIGSQFGVLGMFLAVPVWGIIKVLVQELFTGLRGHHFI